VTDASSPCFCAATGVCSVSLPLAEETSGAGGCCGPAVPAEAHRELPEGAAAQGFATGRGGGRLAVQAEPSSACCG
jgi:hypothetical protein